MEDKMIERINKEIEGLKRIFEVTKTYDPVGNAKIIGMIEMLSIVTGKNYYYDENGLHER
jgi:hypothetical protein